MCGWVLSAHHAGGGSVSAGADHQGGDLVSPELLALLVGEQGQSGLLQQGGGVGG